MLAIHNGWLMEPHPRLGLDSHMGSLPARIQTCDILQVQSVTIRNMPLAWKGGPAHHLAASGPHGTMAQETGEQLLSAWLTGTVVIGLPRAVKKW